MTHLQVFLCVVALGAVHAAPDFLHSATYTAPAAVVAPPAAISHQYHAQDVLGQYSYGYSGGPSAKAESKTADGVTRGGYSYLDAHGILQSVHYVSDDVNGFRVAATNLPVHVNTPVLDTPEVAAAKAAHAVAHSEATVAAAASPDIPDAIAVATAPVVYSAPAPAIVTGHSYTAPGIVSSANGAGGFAYTTTSIAPTYAPHYYSAVLPASTAVYSSVPSIAAAHAYTAPGIIASTNGAGGFAYSTSSLGGYTYAPHYYSAVLPHAGPVLVNGVPADTPEVAAAKLAHYAAHAQERLRHLGWAV